MTMSITIAIIMIRADAISIAVGTVITLPTIPITASGIVVITIAILVATAIIFFTAAHTTFYLS